MIDFPVHAQHFKRIASDASKALNDIRKAAHAIKEDRSRQAELERLKVLEICWKTVMANASSGAAQMEAMK